MRHRSVVAWLAALLLVLTSLTPVMAQEEGVPLESGEAVTSTDSQFPAPLEESGEIETTEVGDDSGASEVSNDPPVDDPESYSAPPESPSGDEGESSMLIEEGESSVNEIVDQPIDDPDQSMGGESYDQPVESSNPQTTSPELPVDEGSGSGSFAAQDFSTLDDDSQEELELVIEITSFSFNCETNQGSYSWEANQPVLLTVSAYHMNGGKGSVFYGWVDPVGSHEFGFNPEAVVVDIGFTAALDEGENSGVGLGLKSTGCSDSTPDPTYVNICHSADGIVFEFIEGVEEGSDEHLAHIPGHANDFLVGTADECSTGSSEPTEPTAIVDFSCEDGFATANITADSGTTVTFQVVTAEMAVVASSDGKSFVGSGEYSHQFDVSQMPANAVVMAQVMLDGNVLNGSEFSQCPDNGGEEPEEPSGPSETLVVSISDAKCKAGGILVTVGYSGAQSDNLVVVLQNEGTEVDRESSGPLSGDGEILIDFAAPLEFSQLSAQVFWSNGQEVVGDPLTEAVALANCGGEDPGDEEPEVEEPRVSVTCVDGTALVTGFVDPSMVDGSSVNVAVYVDENPRSPYTEYKIVPLEADGSFDTEFISAGDGVVIHASMWWDTDGESNWIDSESVICHQSDGGGDDGDDGDEEPEVEEPRVSVTCVDDIARVTGFVNPSVVDGGSVDAAVFRDGEPRRSYVPAESVELDAEGMFTVEFPAAADGTGIYAEMYWSTDGERNTERSETVICHQSDGGDDGSDGSDDGTDGADDGSDGSDGTDDGADDGTDDGSDGSDDGSDADDGTDDGADDGADDGSDGSDDGTDGADDGSDGSNGNDDGSDDSDDGSDGDDGTDDGSDDGSDDGTDDGTDGADDGFDDGSDDGSDGSDVSTDDGGSVIQPGFDSDRVHSGASDRTSAKPTQDPLNGPVTNLPSTGHGTASDSNQAIVSTFATASAATLLLLTTLVWVGVLPSPIMRRMRIR